MTGFRSVVVIASLLASVSASAQQDPILAGYQRFYSGDSDGAQEHFAQLVSSRPADLPARFGELLVLEYQSQIDSALEVAFERKIDVFLEDAERRHSRSATDDEALFYLTGGYLLRAQYRASHGKGMLGAARDGARMKRFAEMYVKRRPEHGDIYLALGVYNYFVELAPAFLRVIRTFLFLPGGNRAEGLKQIERAYKDGNYFSFLAGLTLTDVYGMFEMRPADGLVIGERLARQYPENPTPQFALASLYLSPAVEDHDAAVERYQAVIAREDRRRDERVAKYRARLGLADARFQQWRLEDAVSTLSEIIDANPAKFRGVVPGALLRRGNFRALLDDAQASADARRVRANPSWSDYHEAADEQISWIERRRKSGEAAIYAALIPTNRLAVAGKWDEAAAGYTKAQKQYPNDVQVRFRTGHLAFLRGDMERAIAELTPLVDHRSSPRWLKAQALLHTARAHDVRGRRAEARRLYDRIVDDYENESVAFAARVGLITAYQAKKKPGLISGSEGTRN
jgi:tetratricopeptide (TPR) repeat protein